MRNPAIWDTHHHLQFDPIFHRREEALKAAGKAKIKGVIVPAFSPELWKRQSQMIGNLRTKQALGVHPWWVPQQNFKELYVETKLAFQNLPELWGEDLVAIGEFGLDRSKPKFKSCFQDQIELFRLHLKWARKLELPAILHVVKAHGKALELLAENESSVPGVVHSYSGPIELIPRYNSLGLSLSYSHTLTISEKARLALRNTPENHILFETDGPRTDRAQEPKSKDPASLIEVVKKASEILGRSKEWCWSIHRENTSRIFGID